jgi:hypothetical protein
MDGDKWKYLTSSFPFFSKYGHALDIPYKMPVWCWILDFTLCHLTYTCKAKVEETGISMSGEINVLILAVRPCT